MSEKYVIVTDSGADLPKEILARYGIISLPLVLHFEDGEVKYNDEVAFPAFFARLRAKERVRTAAVNAERFARAFEALLLEGKDIFYIGFSSALSATYGAGKAAAEALRARFPERKIFTVDSFCASLGEGLLVTLAAEKKKEGASIEALYEYVKAQRWHISHVFTVDDLFFLKRGGRVSGATAVLGSMLSVKPLMHVDNEGRLVKTGTVRGRRASVTALFEKMKESKIEEDEGQVYICHGDCYEDARALADMIEREYSHIHVMIAYVGPVIASHSGPGTLGLFYLCKER